MTDAPAPADPQPWLLRTVLPATQRRTAAELADELDLGAAGAHDKRSAFWTMLTLASVVATAGVLGDSTATVIGAMIIAPLSTPIMGIALGVATGSRRTSFRSIGFVAAGTALVVAVGALASVAVPATSDLLANSQIAARTSPGLLDLVAAMATGVAGAVALARRDVAAVLPGVAIAISLVPPLAVVGVCLGRGAVGLALGALVLFASNLLALVLAGTLLFAAVAAGGGRDGRRGEHRRAYVAIGALLLVVGLPLLANTAAGYLLHVLTARVQTAADAWVQQVPGAEVVGVDLVSDELHVQVRTPDPDPPVARLLDALEGQVPAGLDVVVVTEQGERIEVGTTR